MPAGRALRLGDSGVPPLAERTSEGLGPRPPGTSDCPLPLLGPRPAGCPRRFPKRARRATDAGEGASAPSRVGGETGKALEGCPDAGALPGRGTCGFQNGAVWLDAGWGEVKETRRRGLGEARVFKGQ